MSGRRNNVASAFCGIQQIMCIMQSSMRDVTASQADANYAHQKCMSCCEGSRRLIRGHPWGPHVNVVGGSQRVRAHVVEAYS